MECPSCNRENAEDSKFCNNCASSLAQETQTAANSEMHLEALYAAHAYILCRLMHENLRSPPGQKTIEKELKYFLKLIARAVASGFIFPIRKVSALSPSIPL